MRRRPQRNVRRGMIRAATTVVGLTVLILVILLVVSSLTAPKAKAPIVPSTPTPGKSTPGALKTPVATAKPTSRPKTSKSTKKKHSMRSASVLVHRVLAARAGLVNATSSPNGHFLTYFRDAVDAYRGSALMLRVRKSGSERVIGWGDPLVRPVWSRDGTRVLYVRVREVTRFPGAQWTLMTSATRGETRVLAREPGLSMVPLGWSGSSALFLVSSASETSLFRAMPGRRAAFANILISQVVTNASLSPDGHVIAFTLPTNCGYCGLDLFNLDTLDTSYGPWGARAGWNFAWTSDSRAAVADSPHGLAVMSARSGTVSYRKSPSGMPATWPHPFTAGITGSRIVLSDTVSGSRYETGN